MEPFGAAVGDASHGVCGASPRPIKTRLRDGPPCPPPQVSPLRPPNGARISLAVCSLNFSSSEADALLFGKMTSAFPLAVARFGAFLKTLGGNKRIILAEAVDNSLATISDSFGSRRRSHRGDHTHSNGRQASDRERVSYPADCASRTAAAAHSNHRMQTTIAANAADLASLLRRGQL